MIATATKSVYGSNLPDGHRAAVGSEQTLSAKRVKSAEKRLKPGRIHAVLTTLGREIAQEIIPAGAVLPPESDLEIRFGVGRGVIREAIKMLSGKATGGYSVGKRKGQCRASDVESPVAPALLIQYPQYDLFIDARCIGESIGDDPGPFALVTVYPI